VRREFAVHLTSEQQAADGTAAVRSEHSMLLRDALQAARGAVLAMRAGDEIGDDAFHEIEEELDWLEMAAGDRSRGA
jgi:monovalent cation/hydrogen antiporter